MEKFRSEARLGPAAGPPVDSPPTGRMFLTEGELAERWRISVKTLQNWRVTGGGLSFIKGRGFVRYRLADVLAWEAAHTHQSTSGGGSDV